MSLSAHWLCSLKTDAYAQEFAQEGANGKEFLWKIKSSLRVTCVGEFFNNRIWTYMR